MNRDEFMSHSLISIVILNWNGWKDTIECLESLYQITYPNYNVIVIDNGSEDSSIKMIKNWAKGEIPIESNFLKYNLNRKSIKWIEYKREEAEAGGERKIEELQSDEKLIIIKNEKNFGVAEGNNIGMRYAFKVLNSDYVLLLNNDTVVDPEFLKELMKIMKTDPKIGAVCTKVYHYYDPNKLQLVINFINLKTGKVKHIGANETDCGQYNDIKQTDETNGCAFLIRKEIIEKVGMLDSDYFCYYEETDWCIRAKRKGYKLLYIPKAKIWHKVSSSSKKISGFVRYYLTRNRFIFMRKNATKLQFIFFLIYFFLVDFILKTGYLLILRKDLKLLKTFYRAIYDGLRLSMKRDLQK